ncbi:MAG: MYXO-CTERM sorting domain-containing protein [Polyangiaceae bacterium]
MSSEGGGMLRRLLVLAVSLMLTSFALNASAVGSVQWKNTHPKEVGTGSWNLEVTVSLPKAPDVAHIPVKFEFQQTMYYERNLLDGKDGPQLRKVPITNKQAQIESVTIGFLDPGKGTIQKRTRFTFKITRGHGYEAGEYTVTLRDGNTGQTIGRATKLVLEGENPVVDRRSISFVDEADKKKKEQMKGVDKDGNIKDGDEKDGDKTKTGDPAQDDMDVADPGVGKKNWDPVYGAPVDDEAPPLKNEADGPEPIKEKPGGCGCSVPGTHSGIPVSGLLFAAGLVLALTRRRRS